MDRRRCQTSRRAVEGREPRDGVRPRPPLDRGRRQSWAQIRSRHRRSRLPPRALEMLASARAGPPPRSIRCNRPSAKKPIDLPSGDQKGNVAPSVPATIRGSASSRRRTHTPAIDSASTPTNATERPSADSASVSTTLTLSGAARQDAQTAPRGRVESSAKHRRQERRRADERGGAEGPGCALAPEHGRDARLCQCR